jgi:hypothetical protein
VFCVQIVCDFHKQNQEIGTAINSTFVRVKVLMKCGDCLVGVTVGRTAVGVILH